MSNPKYLVRPRDFTVFVLDKNGCYKPYAKIEHTYSDGTPIEAMTHFTYENLTVNYDFYEIEDNLLDYYNDLSDKYFSYNNYIYRNDGHGAYYKKHDITFEEYLKKIENEEFIQR